MSYKNRIKNLERKYSETNIAPREQLFPNTVSGIKSSYDKNQQKRRVDAILNNVRNKDSIKNEVHDIISDVKLKTLCYNCKEEQIIAVIILYVQRTRNSRYQIHKTRLWREYELNWLKYSLIIERLLKWTRENRRVPVKNVDLNNNNVIW